MALSITPELEQQIAANAAARGLSVDTYLRHLVDDSQHERDRQIAALRQRLDESVAAMERGEGVDGEEFMAELAAEIDEAERLQRAG